MGFNIHTRGWTYCQYAYYASVRDDIMGEYYNDTGSDKRITSVTMRLGTGKGSVDGSQGTAMTCYGKNYSTKLVYSNYASTTNATISSVCNTTGAYYQFNQAGYYTFYFDEGAPIVSAGSTVYFRLSLTGLDGGSTSTAIVAAQSSQYQSDFISGTVVDPYSPPSYSINSISPQIGIVNSTTFTVNYTISGGTNGIAWTNARVYNSDGVHLGDIGLSNTSKGTINSTFKIPYSDGQQYKVSIRFSDNHSEFETGTINIYTYRKPTISNVALSNSHFSGTGNGNLSWYTNGRRWSTSLENNFKTYIKFNGKSWFEASNHNPNSDNTASSTQSQIITSTILQNQFSNTERSVNAISTSLSMKRVNPSSGEEAVSGSISLTIQYKPNYAPFDLKYTNNDTGRIISSGETIYFSDEPNIRIQWNYSEAINAGVVTGYIVRIYSDSSYSTLTKTITTSNKYTVINSKTDLTRGTMNYIKVVAYYSKPDGSGNIEGSAIQSMFIKPLGKIKKPVIAYPINNTTWLNDNFRILLQSPEDEDYDSYSSTIRNNYVYKNIELKINNQIFAAYTNGSDLVYPIFSTTTFSHMKKLVINPSISGVLTSAFTFSIQIRFQKNYFENIWSEWSNIITLKKVIINEQTFNIDDKILVTHYNTMRNKSYACWEAYPITSLPTDNIALNIGDNIKQINFKAIYDTIKAIQTNVNNYTTYDSSRNNIKFLQTIDKFEGENKPTDELITALKDPRPNKPGRNYINLMIECLNKLY